MESKLSKQFETFVFDLDGTLLDTLTDLANSCNRALREFGMPERTVEEVRQFLGNGVRRLMGNAVPQGETNPVFEDVLKSYAPRMRDDSSAAVTIIRR